MDSDSEEEPQLPVQASSPTAAITTTGVGHSSEDEDANEDEEGDWAYVQSPQHCEADSESDHIRPPGRRHRRAGASGRASGSLERRERREGSRSGRAVKDEPAISDDDEDLYNVPAQPAEASRRRSPSSSARAPVPAGARAGQSRRHFADESDSDIEVRYPTPQPFSRPTANNQAIADSAEWERKPYARELTQMWEPLRISDRVWQPTMFSRRFLSNVLGGSEHNTRCRPSKKKRDRQVQLFGEVLCDLYLAE